MGYSLKNKICLVTGASDGIGKAIAVLLARHQAHVLVHCRNPIKGKMVVEECTSRGNKNIELLVADFEDLASVKPMADAIVKKHSHLDMLVNNAGAIFKNFGTSSDGFEKTILVNHLSGFLLTKSLLGHLEKGPESLVVNMASSAHYKGTINFESFTKDTGYHGFRAYRQSKLANVLFTYELHRRLQESSTNTFAMHPGLVATNFASSEYLVVEIAFKLFPFLFTSPGKSARDFKKFIDDPASAGKFFYAGKERESSALSYNEELVAELWKRSEEMVSQY